MSTRTTCNDDDCQRCPDACCAHHAHGGADDECDGPIPQDDGIEHESEDRRG